MLSVLLGSAFLARQFWGWLADRIGGLQTLLWSSLAQATALTGFLLTQDEAALFAVSAAFGLGFSGLLPAYVHRDPQVLSGEGGELAGADDVLRGFPGHGGGRLGRGRPL